ncbi:Rab-3A-interacting protein [Choanephora cucurbitarum]|uniref:Rab-3A-interacting protein n=1 Tax=Choanephora cucurbitarum TaxID=101091 RepID=A0A1C7NIC2_9FUNG|nr:Rab-3A-interacting protein [Choanephora cucurbitarum]
MSLKENNSHILSKEVSWNYCSFPQQHISNNFERIILSQAAEIEKLRSEINAKQVKICKYQVNIKALEAQCHAERDRVIEMENQRALVDQEIEELSVKLFEEANRMVSEEKQKRAQLEKLVCVAQEQLIELKSSMIKVVVPPPRSSSLSSLIQAMDNDTSSITTTNSSESQDSKKIHYQSMLLETDFDQAQIKSFYDYVSSCRLSANKSQSSLLSYSSSSDTRCSKVVEQDKMEDLEKRNSMSSDTLSYASTISQQSEYMLQCENEDIVPCLQFGNPESRMNVKRMMECMMHRPCFIESITSLDEIKKIFSPSHSSSSAYHRPLIWERWSSFRQHALDTDNSIECAACAKKVLAESNRIYRFRLDEQDDWLLIDQNCRDRLVAVCNFYSFVRNIQLGLFENKSLELLYLETIELRKKMFYSR